MYKTIKIIVLATLCLNFSSKAQDNKAIDVTTKGLQIGQKIPQIESLSKYKGKLIILDFWATWCSPCIAMIPKMEALQEQFDGKVQIIPVTYQSKEIVAPFLQKLHKGKVSNLPEITGDKELQRLFPHIYLPHYVWIDQTGIVAAITGYEEVNAGNIEKMLLTTGNHPSGQPSLLKQKQDLKIAYNSQKPLMARGNGTDGSSLLFHSVLMPYTEGIQGGYRLGKLDNPKYQRITALNSSILTLHKIAYGEKLAYYGRSKTVLEVKDPEPISYTSNDGLMGDWMKSGHGYCYELLVDTAFKGNRFELMKEDLKRFFPQYSTKIEKRKAVCYVLVRTSPADKLRSKGGTELTRFDVTGCLMQNMYLQRFISQLETKYLQLSTMPFVNETNYLERVDMTINAPLGNIKAINIELAKYDLQFIEAEREVDMMIIYDSVNTTQTK